jgi:glycosyltransferase involved in cell wall biosynthesis
MRVLVVSSYPPRHCGIGAYAQAQVTRLRADGHEVVVLTPTDGEGDERMDFLDGRPFRRATELAPGFDVVVIHFEPGIYFRPRAAVSKVRTALALARTVSKTPNAEIVVHETFPAPVWWRPDHRLLRRALARARLVVHTEAERDVLARAYGARERVRVVPHAEGILLHGPASRHGSRSRLGIAMTERLYLCAGFLTPAKAFERAIRAFEEAGSPGRLVVLASVRTGTEPNLEYGRSIASLCDRVRGVDLIDRFVPDDEFDAWIAAADAVVLPYRRAWSSGVLARAQAIGTPALVSAVGGLADQASARDIVFSTDDELTRAFATATISRRTGSS